MQTRAIVDFGDLDLNRAMQIYGPVGDLAVYKARYYPSKAPLMSFAAVPVYVGLRVALGRTPGAVSELDARILQPALADGAAHARGSPLAAGVCWSSTFRPATADAIALTYALGTLAFSYSLLFMSHQPSAVLLFAAFYGLWRWSRGEWPDRTLFALVSLASASVVAEYTTAIAVLALALYGILTLTRRRESLVVRLSERAHCSSPALFL